MKNIKKLLLVFGIVPLLLTACESDKQYSDCLETSNDTTYFPGMVYRASYNDVVESVYLISPALNPEAPINERTYDISWKDDIKLSCISFAEGLKGKKVINAMKLADNVLRVKIENTVENKNTTFGYLQITPDAFKANNPDLKETILRARVELGEKSALIDKNEYKAFCLETSDTAQYVDGKCYQISKENEIKKYDEQGNVIGTEDKVEKFYLINKPINPEASENEWQYDIKWKENLSVSDFTFVEGLGGKIISKLERVSDNVVYLEIFKALTDKNETSGYVRVKETAFDALTETAKDKRLYAYVSIGEESGMINK